MSSPKSANLAGIVLAAGGSSRLGYSKQLVEYKGEALVRRAVKAAVQAELSPVIVVIGSEADSVQAVLGDLLAAVIVLNPEWQTGLASSLRTGLAEAAKSSADGAIVITADQPRVSAEDLRHLTAAFDEGHRLIASTYNGVLGVPAIFAREFFADLSRLSGDAGAGGWLRARSNAVTSVPLNCAAFDVDTEQDVRTLLRDGPAD